MKNFKKKIAALGLAVATVASSVMSVSASALEYDYWPAYYVPYRCDFYADTNVVRVQNVKWTSSQIEAIKSRNPLVPSPSIELEFRPASPTANPHEIWDSVDGALSTNMPNGHFEFQDDDYDDVTVSIRNVKDCTPEQGYYATQKMNPKVGGYTDVTYDFACELGTYSHLKGDSLPLRKAYFSRTVSFGHWDGWQHGGIIHE